MNPIVERISQYGLATEIIFKCPKCGTSFAILGDNEKYCHNCGTEMSWENIPRYVSKRFANMYHNSTYEEQKEIISLYNEKLVEFLKEF